MAQIVQYRIEYCPAEYLLPTAGEKVAGEMLSQRVFTPAGVIPKPDIEGAEEKFNDILARVAAARNV